MNTHAWPRNWTRDYHYRALYDRLRWLYGEERATRMVQGDDEPTNTDLDAWRKLGRR